jgi:hypothetical protein
MWDYSHSASDLHGKASVCVGVQKKKQQQQHSTLDRFDELKSVQEAMAMRDVDPPRGACGVVALLRAW